MMKLLISLVFTMLALFPTWMYIAALQVLNPEGFWQNFLLLGAGVWFLGALQIILLIFLVCGIFWVWTEWQIEND